MYKCNNCNAAFEQYDTILDTNQEQWHVCPYCRGIDFDEAKKCEYCGNYFVESRDDVTCENCLGEVKTRFSNMLNNNFTEHEKKLLNIIYDGRNLG